MNMKYRQAIANLAKQATVVKVKQVDPLASICALRIQAVKKTKHIHKKNMKPNSTGQSKTVKQKSDKNEKNSQILRLMVAKQRRKKPKQFISLSEQDNWQKYLPQKQDQFQQANIFKAPNKQLNTLQNNLTQKILIKNQDIHKQKETQQKGIALQPSSLSTQNSSFNINQLDIQLLKKKLGIGIKVEAAKPEVVLPPTIPNPELKQTQNTALLPFVGRAFQQAPPRPEPKKIHQYPPTCKIAGIYPWPPPQSQYRRWKNQMRESRKLP